MIDCDPSTPHERGGSSGQGPDDPSAEELIHDTLIAAATKLMLANAATPADRHRLVKLAREELAVLTGQLGGEHRPGEVGVVEFGAR